VNVNRLTHVGICSLKVCLERFLCDIADNNMAFRRFRANPPPPLNAMPR
jgi:hypothetical protein